MELFCGCKESEAIFIPEIKHSRKQYKRGMDNRCKICEYWPWYDADHENMMFDLRNMNITG